VGAGLGLDLTGQPGGIFNPFGSQLTAQQLLFQHQLQQHQQALQQIVSTKPVAKPSLSRDPYSMRSIVGLQPGASAGLIDAAAGSNRNLPTSSPVASGTVGGGGGGGGFLSRHRSVPIPRIGSTNSLPAGMADYATLFSLSNNAGAGSGAPGGGNGFGGLQSGGGGGGNTIITVGAVKRGVSPVSMGVSAIQVGNESQTLWCHFL
jgi:hypothetical protein